MVDEKFYLVDLPGFGFAATNKSDTFRFSNLIQQYFKLSNKIALVFHLMDSRVPFTNLDTLANEYVVKLNLPYCILFTKVDKLNQSERAKLKKTATDVLQGFDFLFYSSKTGEGKKELRNYIIKKIIDTRV